jgi:hypothetical protein
VEENELDEQIIAKDEKLELEKLRQQVDDVLKKV